MDQQIPWNVSTLRPASSDVVSIYNMWSSIQVHSIRELKSICSDLVGLHQHPFLPGVKGSDTVCRKMRGNLGCKLKVKPRIIWAALTRRVRGGYVHASSQLQVERFKTEICEAFGVVSFDPETSRSLSRSKSSGVVSPVLVCI